MHKIFKLITSCKHFRQQLTVAVKINHMKIDIKATKLELSKEIKDYIQKKVDMLERYLGNIKVINCHVEVGLAVGGQTSGQIYRAEINLDLPGELLRVDRTAQDIFKALDKTKDHMVDQIKKYKEKKIERKRRS